MLDPYRPCILHALYSSTEEADLRSTLCTAPCLMTAVTPESQPLCGRKRRRGAIEEEHSTTAATSPQPPWKRAKRPFQSRQEANTTYWDSLSKLWFTRRALKELNRRNRQAASPVRTEIIRRPDLSGEPAALKNCPPQLKRFARHGGPDLRDLRGVTLAQVMSRPSLICSLQYPELVITNSTAHAMPSSQSTSRTRSKSTNTLGESTVKSSHRKSSAYHRDFEQHLIDHGIHPNNRTRKPHNWEEIQQKMAQPRPSLSPSKFSDGAFETFQQANEEALTEAMVMRKPFPIISGDADIHSAGELPFGNLKPLTDGTLVDAKPDFYDGARPAQIDRRIRIELGSSIIPSAQHQAPALPNFFTEVKGPDGSGAVAKRQACYDGVVGERGIDEFRAFGVDKSETVYNNNSYTITSTYHSATGTLQIYTIHSTKPTDPDSSPEYYMTQLNSFAMTGTAGRFREGASAFRNARDWAEERRNEIITTANGRLKGMPRETSTLESSGHSMQSQSTNGPAALESETSADELAQDMSEGSSFSHKRLKRGSAKRHSRLGPKKCPKKGYSGADGRSDSSVGLLHSSRRTVGCTD